MKSARRRLYAAEPLEAKLLLAAVIPDILIDDVVVTESWQGCPQFGNRCLAEIPIKLTHATSETVTVQYQTTEAAEGPGIAEAGRDFIHRMGSVVFAPNQTSSTIRIPIISDGEIDTAFTDLECDATDATDVTCDTESFFGNERFYIDIQSASGARIQDASSKVNIVSYKPNFDLAAAFNSFGSDVESASNGDSITVTVGASMFDPGWFQGRDPECDSLLNGGKLDGKLQDEAQSGAYAALPDVGGSIRIRASLRGVSCDSYSFGGDGTGYYDSIGLSLLKEQHYGPGFDVTSFADPLDTNPANERFGQWYFAEGGEFWGNERFTRLDFDREFNVPLNGGFLNFLLDTSSGGDVDKQFPTSAQLTLSVVEEPPFGFLATTSVPPHNDSQYLILAGSHGLDYALYYQGDLLRSGEMDGLVEVISVPSHLKRDGFKMTTEYDCGFNGDIALKCQHELLTKQHISPPTAGDANFDGIVDATDLYIWNQNRFTTNPVSPLNTSPWRYGDFNVDGFVDGSDFNIWLDAFNSKTAQASAGDLGMDGGVTASDIDALRDAVNAVQSGLQGYRGYLAAHYDVNNDGQISDADIDHFVRFELGSNAGDVNLDHVVDSADLNIVYANWGRPGGWANGDLNGDGIVSSADLNKVALNLDWRWGDLSGDNDVDADDIDLLYAKFGWAPNLDLTGDGYVTQRDVDRLVHDVLGTSYGDADLDGDVDYSDFMSLIQHWNHWNVGWRNGDFNGDGVVNYADYQLM